MYVMCVRAHRGCVRYDLPSRSGDQYICVVQVRICGSGPGSGAETHGSPDPVEVWSIDFASDVYALRA